MEPDKEGNDVFNQEDQIHYKQNGRKQQRERGWSYLSFHSDLADTSPDLSDVQENGKKKKKKMKKNKSNKDESSTPQLDTVELKGFNHNGHDSTHQPHSKRGNNNKRDELGKSNLHSAVLANNLERVIALLAQEVDFQSTDETGDTPLHSAARNGNEAIVEQLLQHQNCDPDVRNYENATPLHIAAEIDHLNISKLLVGKNASLNPRTNDNATPLARAAAKANDSVVDYLLTIVDLLKLPSEEFLYNVDEDGSTLLHLAVDCGSKTSVESCLEHGANVREVKRKDKSTAFHNACSLGSLKIVDLLASYDPDVVKMELVDDQNMTLLHRAAQGKHVPIVQFLLNEDAAVNPRDMFGKTPLLLASEVGATETVDLLMENGGDVTIKDEEECSVLHAANGFIETTAVLLKSPACTSLVTDKNVTGNAPIHYAAKHGHAPIVNMFLKKNKACGIVTSDEVLTALHLCSRYGHVEVAEALLNKRYMKAINATNSDGRTALHFACASGRDAIVDLLLSEGATAEMDKKNRTPLHIAAQLGSERCVHSVVRAQSSCINALDQTKNTALNLAAINGHVKIVNFLLSQKQQGILVNARNQDVLDLVIEGKQVEVAMAIANHDRWKEIITGNSKGVTKQLQILIEKLPAVAQRFLDRCMTEEGDPEEDDYKVSFDLTLIQGTHDKQKSKTKGASLSSIQTMLDLRRDSCMTHPVSHALLNLKWKKYGWIAFFVNVFIYLCFVLPLTVFAILVKVNQKELCVFNATETEKPFYGNDLPSTPTHTGLRILHWLTVVITACLILKEMFQIYSKRMEYFHSFTNIMEMCVYQLALVYLLPVSECEAAFKPETAAFCIFFAWMNLLLYFRRLSFYGTYVIMLITMFQTLVQVLFLLVLFMITFATVFFILFEDMTAYGSFGNSFLNIFAMTLGELNYADTFFGDDYIPFRTSTNVMFIFFVLAMPIIMMNMLVGLAVGDIDAIKQNAAIARYIMQVELLLELEISLPDWIVRRANMDQFTDHPNSPKSLIVQLYDTSIGFSRPPDDEPPPMPPQMLEMKQKVEEQDKKVDEIYKLIKVQANVLRMISQQSDGKEDGGGEDGETDGKEDKKKGVFGF